MNANTPPDRVAWRWFLLGVITLGWLLRSNALQVGLMGDDYMQLAMLEGLYPGERSVFDLYHFIRADPVEQQAHLELGSLPWWSWSELHGGVFRPLSSLSLALDHALFGVAPRWAHIHSLLWWTAMLLAAARLLRRRLPHSIAVLGVLILALDAGVTMNIGWIANRCALIAATFAFVAIDAHISARKDGRAFGGWASLAAFVASLMGGEYGLVSLAYLLGWELCEGAKRDGRALARALVGPSLVALVFVAIYQLGGYGTHGAQAVYAHPLDAPWDYLQHLSHRLPRAWAELWLSMPAAPGDLLDRPFFAWLGMPGLDALRWASWIPATPTQTQLHFHHAVIAGALLAGLAAVYAFGLRRGQPLHTRWLVVGAALGVLPVLVAPAHGRLFLISALGASASLAELMVRAWARMRDASLALWQRSAWGFFLLVLGWTQVLADPAWSRIYMERFGEQHARLDAGTFALGDAAVDGKDVIVLSALGQTRSIHGVFAHVLHGHARPRSWHTLSMAPVPLLVQRPSAQTLVLSPARGAWLDTPPERFFRPADAPMTPGTRVSLGVAEVELLRVDAQGRPAAIRVDFAEPLESERYLFVRSVGALEPLPLPPIGGATMVPAPRDLPAAPGPTR